jgi:hypothetical protein
VQDIAKSARSSLVTFRYLAIVAVVLSGGAVLSNSHAFQAGTLQSIIPAYHGAIFLGVSIMASVVLSYVLGEMRTFEERAHQLRIATLEASTAVSEGKARIAAIDAFESRMPSESSSGDGQP